MSSAAIPYAATMDLPNKVPRLADFNFTELEVLKIHIVEKNKVGYIRNMREMAVAKGYKYGLKEAKDFADIRFSEYRASSSEEFKQMNHEDRSFATNLLRQAEEGGEDGYSRAAEEIAELYRFRRTTLRL